MSGGTHTNLPQGSGHSGVAVTAPVAQVSANPAAQTSAASVGVPTKVEFDKTVADITALRAQVVNLVTDVANSRVFEAALRTSLRNGSLIA
jgi:hypothetical protein